MKVKVRKVRSLDPKNPGLIVEGTEYSGDVEGLPKVGERYYISGPLKFFSSSPVEEILDNYHFRTMNSIYHFQVLTDDKESIHPGRLGESISSGQPVFKESGVGSGVYEKPRDTGVEFKAPFKINV